MPQQYSSSEPFWLQHSREMLELLYSESSSVTPWSRTALTGEWTIDFDDIYEKLVRLGYDQVPHVGIGYVFVMDLQRHECPDFSFLDMVKDSLPYAEPNDQLAHAYSVALAAAFMELVPKP